MSVQPVSTSAIETLDVILGNPEQLALVSTAVNGVPTSAIAIVTWDGDEAIITPLAVLVNDDLFAHLSDPGEGL